MKFSNEMIHAYVDGELQGNEKLEFEKELEIDDELQCTLNEIYELKLELRHAYQSVLPEPIVNTTQNMNYRIAAYAFFLLLAFSGGWVGGVSTNEQSAEYVDVSAEETRLGESRPGKYIVHIGIQDSIKFKKALDKAEALLTNYKGNQQQVELEVIANAGGLNLFREDASPHAQRVKQLSQAYPNIKFIACANGIERLREQGINPNLINSVHKGPTTALDQVVKRMNQGWTYIKI